MRPHGIRGEAVVESLSDNPTRFRPGSRLGVSAPERRGEPHDQLDVSTVRPHKGRLLIVFEGISEREQVDALRGHWLEVPRDEVPSSQEGSFYFFDLVGCRCLDRAEGELGDVTQVIEDGGGYLLEIVGSRGQILVPFVNAYLLKVDVEGGVIEVDLPEGLVEACISKS